MSSIMRRRRGLISAIWGTSCLRIGLRRPQSCQTGGLPSQPLTFYNYCDSGLVVCPACSIAWGWKSPIQPDGGEGLAKHKGVIARWGRSEEHTSELQSLRQIVYRLLLEKRTSD